METKMNIQEYMTAGVENIIRNALKVTLTNPAQSIFMTRFAAASKAASKKRQISEKEGEHIPAFLIARSPFAPSPPIPVKIIPKAFLPAAFATD